VAAAVLAAPPPVYPWPIGPAPRWQPTAQRRAGEPVGDLRCNRGGVHFRVHLELFADRQVIVVPPGIGVARSGCAYPLRTRTPTGIVEVGRRGLTLGDLFRVWGRRLGPRRLLSFTGRVRVYVGGRRRAGDPRTLALTPRAEIVVEVGAYVAPHRSYVFPRSS
jgi:hypothetical protein